MVPRTHLNHHFVTCSRTSVQPVQDGLVGAASSVQSAACSRFSEAMSITKRYFTSFFSIRS